MRFPRSVALVAVLAASWVIGVSAASAHQTLVNNNVAVTLHVAPNDEPTAGVSALVSIVRHCRTRNGKFTWATCSCTMTIFEPGGDTLLDGKAVPKIEFVFPEPKAYGIKVTGRVKRAKHWAKFTVTFGIRADPAPTSNG